MVVVFMWLTAHVVGAQFLVEYANSELDSKSAVSAVLQYFSLLFSFLVGGVAWDVLMKIRRAEIAWANVLVTVKNMGKLFLCMLAFLIAARAVSSGWFSAIFFLAFLGCDWKFVKEYLYFLNQIKEGVVKL
ncbi:MAG: hypothetical protein WA056_13635 [Gallionella sp.]